MDPHTGLVMRAMLVSPADGAQKPIFEVTQVSFGPPTASLFQVPSQCNAFAIVPKTDAAAEGWPAPEGPMGQYAWNAVVGPASK